MKRILVATDGSPGADRAVDYAAQLAKDTGARLLAVNVTGSDGLPGEIFRRLTRRQQIWLDEMFDSVATDILKQAQDRARQSGVESVELEARRGDVAHTIMQIADDMAVDAIVIGKRGWSPVTSLLLGSVSQKLVSLASHVVVVVP